MSAERRLKEPRAAALWFLRIALESLQEGGLESSVVAWGQGHAGD